MNIQRLPKKVISFIITFCACTWILLPRTGLMALLVSFLREAELVHWHGCAVYKRPCTHNEIAYGAPYAVSCEALGAEVVLLLVFFFVMLIRDRMGKDGWLDCVLAAAATFLFCMLVGGETVFYNRYFHRSCCKF